MQQSPRSEEEQNARVASTARILQEILAIKIGRNPAFSLRALARDLGVSHTYLSLVLNGKKTLSMRKVIEFSEMIKMDAGLGADARKTAELFLKAGSREVRGRAMERVRLDRGKTASSNDPEVYFELEADRFRVLSEWYHLPILDLTLLEGFRSEVKWIARKLGISPAQVRDAIERLRRLGLLEEKDGKLLKAHRKIVVQPRNSERAVREFHQQMIAKAGHSLEQGGDEAMRLRDITGVTIPIDPSRLPEAKKRIQAFRRSLWKFLSGGRSTELYQLNLQLFPLTVEGKIQRTKSGLLKRGGK